MKKILTILFICVGLNAFSQELDPITTTNLRVIINRINTLQGLVGTGGLSQQQVSNIVKDSIDAAIEKGIDLDTEVSNIVKDSIDAAIEKGIDLDTELAGYEPSLGNPSSNGHILYSTSAGERSWGAPPAGGTMTWPASAGIAIYAGSNQWGTSITNNSTNWNTAYGWGNHKVMDINTQTGSTYTLVLTDAHKLIIRSNSSANTVTVPTNNSVAFPIGTQITVVQVGTGTTSIAAAGGVTINSADGALDLRVRYSTCSLVKTATDTWLLIGDMEVPE